MAGRADFTLDAFARRCLMMGVDQLGYLLAQGAAIETSRLVCRSDVYVATAVRQSRSRRTRRSYNNKNPSPMHFTITPAPGDGSRP